jgi:hypothetical protein
MRVGTPRSHQRSEFSHSTGVEWVLINPDDEPQRKFVKDVGNLCELRVLRINNIRNKDDCVQIDLMQCLSNLKKMQHLTLSEQSVIIANMNAWDASVSSRDI